jgi:hypothetical protein
MPPICKGHQSRQVKLSELRPRRFRRSRFDLVRPEQKRLVIRWAYHASDMSVRERPAHPSGELSALSRATAGSKEDEIPNREVLQVGALNTQGERPASVAQSPVEIGEIFAARTPSRHWAWPESSQKPRMIPTCRICSAARLRRPSAGTAPRGASEPEDVHDRLVILVRYDGGARFDGSPRLAIRPQRQVRLSSPVARRRASRSIGFISLLQPAGPG